MFQSCLNPASNKRREIILPRWPLILRTDTIKPVIGSAEVASRIPNDRNVEILQRGEDILSKAILVGQRVTGVIDAAVDAPAHVPIEKQLVLVQLLMGVSNPAEYS